MQHGAPITPDGRAGGQIDGRQRSRQRTQRRSSESDVLEVPRVCRALRQVPGEQRQVEPDPEERDEPQRNVHMLCVHLPGEPGRAMGDAAHRAQQAELVGGRLVVVQHDAPHQRQRTRPVVGKTHHDAQPRHLHPAVQIRRLRGGFHVRPMAARQPLDLLGVHRMHAPRAVHRPPQRKGDHTPGLQERHELAEAALPVPRRDEHPHRVEQDQVECQPGAPGRGELRKAFREQLEAALRTYPLGLPPHCAVGFDGDDFVPALRQPLCVPAATRADIEDATALLRQQIAQPRI